MVGVIDVGSNSVRLLLTDNGAFVSKDVIITKLADGLSQTGKLNKESILRTASAVDSFKNKAISLGAKKVYVFATAAVRSASNGLDFAKEVKSKSNLTVDVISGEKEALYGITGVLKGDKGGVIDIGGASSEIIVNNGVKTVYSYSLDLGVVRLKDICGQDVDNLRKICKERVLEYGIIPNEKFYGIGGTATSLASIALELEVYDRTKVHNYFLTKKTVDNIAEMLSKMTVLQREKVKGLQPQRAEVMLGGAVLMSTIMDYLNIDGITVSEDDNLEGYLIVNNLTDL